MYLNIHYLNCRFACRSSHASQQHLLHEVASWHPQRQVAHRPSKRTTSQIYTCNKLITFYPIKTFNRVYG
jgi:hypothetical protein